MAERKTKQAKEEVVELLTLHEGDYFFLPMSGRKGKLLRPPTFMGVYCRLFNPKAKSDSKDDERYVPYEDVLISSATQGVPLSKPEIAVEGE